MEEIIFHQFQRYKTAQIIINGMRRQKSQTILEVGSGSHGNLGKFLPDDQIIYLDSSLTKEALAKENFVLGDATKLEYEDQSFDFVIALDVLEHIPPQKREAFLYSVTRVAKIGLIMTYPSANAENICNEQILDSTYHLVKTEVPPWIHEHRECSLPGVSEILQMLSKFIPSKNVLILYQMCRDVFLRLLILEALASANANVLEIFQALSNYYNSTVFYHDLEKTEQTAAKTCMIWCRDPGTLDLEKQIWKVPADKNIVDQFKRKLDLILACVVPQSCSPETNGLEKYLEQNKYVKDLQNAYANSKSGYDQLFNQFKTVAEDGENVRTAYKDLKTDYDRLQSQYDSLESYTKDLQNAYGGLKAGYDQLQNLVASETEEKEKSAKSLEDLRQFENKVKKTKWWKYLGSKRK